MKKNILCNDDDDSIMYKRQRCFRVPNNMTKSHKCIQSFTSHCPECHGEREAEQGFFLEYSEVCAK